MRFCQVFLRFRFTMPELPEVETMVRGIRPHVEGREIVALRKCRCSRKPISVTPGFASIARRVRGTTIQSVRRIAKRVILELSNEYSLVIEPRMTGLMLLSDPPSKAHLRLRWELTPNGSDFNAFWFWDRRGLGTFRMYAPGEMETDLATRLGPDALEISVAQWRNGLARTQRAIKVALLDQKLVAGIGNLYASEILHAAQIHPQTVCSQLTATQVKAIHRCTRRILTRAIRYEGSTLNDGTYRNALNAEGGYQNEHCVYGREHETCQRCRAQNILRIVQAQRSTFFCPVCQPEVAAQ